MGSTPFCITIGKIPFPSEDMQRLNEFIAHLINSFENFILGIVLLVREMY